MRPGQWLCFTALFIRSYLAHLHRITQLPTPDHCMRPSFLQLLRHLPFCSAAFARRGSGGSVAGMSGAGWDYSRHNVRCIKAFGLEPMDVIIAGRCHDAKEHVIFFGGDVQDYPENMQSHRNNGKYIRWNSIWTAGRLCERFPTAMVLVVKPHHMHLKTFSVYSQFVQSNDFGVPEHSPDFGAWQTLVDVYVAAVGTVLGSARDAASSNRAVGTQNDAAKSSDSGDFESSSSVQDALTVSSAEGTSAERRCEDPSESMTCVIDVPVYLIGFSKGCIVLNQLVNELETVEKKEKIQKFLSRVRNMYWLDGGHSGGSNSWVTDQRLLTRLAAYKIDIHVHVTPYQVKDKMRYWIGKEKRRFVEILLKCGAKVEDTLHFDDEPKSIENHFRVLEVF